MSISPPLFLTAVGADRQYKQALFQKDTHWAWQDGLWYCEVEAPNGAHVQTGLEVRKEEQPYERFLQALQHFGSPDSLWIDPADDVEPVRDGVDEGLIAWSNASPLQRQALNLSQSDSGEIALEPVGDGSVVEFLQYYSDPGPSIILCWPSGARLISTSAVTLKGHHLRPWIVQRSVASAYWGFVRHSMGMAARSLASVAIQRCVNRKAAPWETLIAAHWLIQTGADNGLMDDVAAVRSALAESAGMDASVLSWALAFDYEDAVCESQFSDIAKKIVARPPIHVEVFRVFVERLSSARRRFEADGSDIRDQLSQVDELGAATYWDAEFMSYRGLAPGRPDRGARGAQLDPDIKKKIL